MGRLIPVQYGIYKYPIEIQVQVVERAGHFDKETLGYVGKAYSLHTEYSYGRRSLSNQLIRRYPGLVDAQENGIPQLWYSEEWARAFARYLIEMVGDNVAPEVIEIHPPFKNYCVDIAQFLKLYKVFEDEIVERFPATHIFIENRFGTQNRSEFLISRVEELKELCGAVKVLGLKLKLALDLPQLLNAHGIFQSESEVEMKIVLREVYRIRSEIGGIHLWGSMGRKKHVGNLDTLFQNNNSLKETFLDCIGKIFIRQDVDDIYFVPEVNPYNWNSPLARKEVEDNIASMIDDLRRHGFQFK